MITLFLFNFNRDLGRNYSGSIVNRFKCCFINNKYYIIDNYFFNEINISDLNTFFFVKKIINNLFFRNSLLIYCLNSNDDIEQNRLFIKSINVNKGDVINLYNKSSLSEGDSSNVFNFSYGNVIFNIENSKTKKSTYCKSFLSYSIILCFNDKHYFIKFPSSSVVKIDKNSKVFLGKPDGLILNYLYKAGVSKVYGSRPCVRGKSMNVIDHPHGGGTGKTSIGRKSIYSIYGKMFKGVNTSKRK